MRILLVLGTIFLLMGCNDEHTYFYLMTHPAITAKLALDCETASAKSAYCDRIEAATVNLLTTLKEQQMDPEAFGESILQAQMAVEKVKAKMIALQSRMQTNTLSNAPDSNEFKKQQAELQQLQNLLRQENEIIQIRLAIVAMSSPQ